MYSGRFLHYHTTPLGSFKSLIQPSSMFTLRYFDYPELTLLHRGKVRDSFRLDNATRLIVVSDRISAFNQKIQTPIPYKGAVLNTLANFWFDQTTAIIPNHVIRQIDPNMTLVQEAEPIRVEMVVRGYLAGSMWRDYQKGKRTFSGITLPDGLTQNHAFAQPILTPTTKDDFDTEVTEEQIIALGLASAELYQTMKEKALELYQFGAQFLSQRGLILVDTKYEFGLLDGELILIDEIHTPDSSRFWELAAYQADPQQVEQFDKEFVRLWLIDNRTGEQYPDLLPESVVLETSRRYLDIYQRITDRQIRLSEEPIEERMRESLEKVLEEIHGY